MTRLSEAVHLYQGALEEQLDRIEDKLDEILKRDKPKERQDKEKAIKDTMPCVERQVDTL